ncbi:MAG: glycosyltransferase family 39 protein [Chloroflexi bacterium]|nr:glycosyltransferase family 39 protein [Chloroflexota bacterium]MCI0574663.1 glycosyltransferase family 39 protein [Chloroflexota bacterium]MCI0649055.1 glycosyltransferase family 39 protein [Chloroflexota bacterium]MCI0725152.1 glycosyltransferase family 39 protein [Chloroflexota bacterium]
MAISKPPSLPLSQRPKVAALPPITRLFPFLLGALALAARLVALGRYVTPDEPMWVYRSLLFRQALLAADWPATIRTGHPGVTTTWLGAVAIQFQLWLQPEARVHLEWLNRLYWLSPDNSAAFQHLAVFLGPARLAVALVNGLGVVAIYALARSRLGTWPAVLGALLLALDPFASGLAGLLHLDALLATFMLITFLLALPAREAEQPAIDLSRAILAGITTTLAILSKTPGLWLGVAVPAAFLWRAWRASAFQFGGHTVGLANRILPVLRLSLRPALAWAGAALASLLLLLPASWAAPDRVVGMTSRLADRLVDSAIRPTFFLGQVILEPGLAFYPVAILFRLSPAVTLGLLAGVSLAVYRLIRPGLRRQRPVQAGGAGQVAGLLLFSLGFIVLINLPAKRYDRYALPAVLPLVLVAGWGVAQLGRGRWLAVRRWPTIARWPALALLLLQVLYWLVALPYPLLAYNWLLGGPAAAQTALPVGWGEAAGAAARWLAETTPDPAGRALFTSNIPATAPFYPGPVLLLKTEAFSRLQSGDALLYVSQDWQFNPAAFQPDPATGLPRPVALGEASVAYSLRFGAVPQAAVYTGLDAADLALQPLAAGPRFFRFNQAVQLVSAGAVPATWPGRVQAVLGWQVLQPADFQLRLALLDETGQVWAGQETALLNEEDHPARYWPAGATQVVYYLQAVPPTLPPGEYTLAASLFDSQGAQLGAFLEDGRFAGTVVPLATFTLDPPASQPLIAIPHPLPGEKELAGYGDLPTQVGNGDLLTLELWWDQGPATPPAGNLELQLGPASALAPLETTGWLPGQTYQIRPTWRVPVELPAGRYPLAVQLRNETGQTQWPEAISLGQLEVVARERRFDLPAGLEPLMVRFADLAFLQQVEAGIADGKIHLALTWQAIAPAGRPYTVFIHLRDTAGNILSQVDRAPAEATTNWAPGQVVVEGYELPAPAAGGYTIAVGLYDVANGWRLPAATAGGALLPDDQYLVEITVP